MAQLAQQNVQCCVAMQYFEAQLAQGFVVFAVYESIVHKTSTRGYFVEHGRQLIRRDQRQRNSRGQVVTKNDMKANNYNYSLSGDTKILIFDEETQQTYLCTSSDTK